MSVAGSWQITMDTPIGTQKFTWDIKAAGEGWAGTMTGPTGTSELNDIRLDGSNLGMKARVDSPMGKLDLAFAGALQGNQISGTCRTQFGNLNFSGQRV
jgi:hypothetical protein